MPVTSPDNIFYLDNTNAAGLIPYSATLATSVQEALNARSEGQQVRTYKWADSAEQAAQAGMTSGDLGYRVDLDTLYRWNGVAWRAMMPGLNLIRPSSVTGGTANTAGRVTFSNVSSVSLNGVFTPEFDHYEVVLNVTSKSASSRLQSRLRAGGTDNTTASSYISQQVFGLLSTVAASSVTESFWDNLSNTNTEPVGARLTFYSPAVATPTRAVGVVQTNFAQTLGLRHTQSVAYDGITFFPSSGNISGTVSVYGFYNG